MTKLTLDEDNEVENLKRKLDQIHDPTEKPDPPAKRRLFLPLPFGGIKKPFESPKKVLSLSLKKIDQ